MGLLFWNPEPAPPGIFQGQPLPYKDASPLSKLLVNWISPMMKVAMSRPVQPEDMYDLTPTLKTRELGNALEARFMDRIPPSQRPATYSQRSVPKYLGQKSLPPSGELIKTHPMENAEPPRTPDEIFAANAKLFGERKARKIRDHHMVVENGKIYDQSLLKAIYLVCWRDYWFSAILECIGFSLRVTAPMVLKVLIQQITQARELHLATNSGTSTNGVTPPKSIGYMVGAAFGLWAMLMTASTLLYYSLWRSNLVGRFLTRSLTTLVARKSMRLSGKARIEMDHGRITTMVSVDVAMLQRAMGNANDLVSTPLLLIIATTLLIVQLGYSALVGLGVSGVVECNPVWFVRHVARLRKEQNQVVDTRVRMLSEILNNIRAVKLYAYEVWFGDRIAKMRGNELGKFKSNILSRSILTSTMSFVPTLAAILTFITYSLTGHELTAALVFANLQIFNVIRSPIAMAPEVLSSLSEAAVAIRRIGEMLRAEELKKDLKIEASSEYGIVVQGDFQFEAAQQLSTQPAQDHETKAQVLESHEESADKGEKQREKEKRPFALRDLDVKIPRGALVCIVGRVGTGKTALLSGLINEMKQVYGHVSFGGSVSYVPQVAWVQSGTIRENITFSVEQRDVDLAQVEHVIDACGLRPDVEMWPDGDLTNIGERGITLSGGQRQRICIARAAYERSDVVLLDDPLSAVDAHVGHHLMENCILNGPMAQRTRLLVTHQLDILDKADLVLVMDRDETGDGRIMQQGRYHDLLAQDGIFRNLIEQFGSATHPSLTDEIEANSADGSSDSNTDSEAACAQGSSKTKPEETAQEAGAKLIIDEERAEGAVRLDVYVGYVRAIGTVIFPIVCTFFLVSAQAAAVFNVLFLGFWSGNEFENLSQGAYMGIYGGLGVAMALLNWAATYGVFLAGIRASFRMFNLAWTGVMRSPTSWHDRTPTGRIISRLSKDIEFLDDRLPTEWYHVFSNSLNIIGALGLVLYSYPYAGLFFIPDFVFTWLTISYYRQTSREIQRLTSILRSHVFTNLSEQLSGLPVIRAFRQQDRCIKKFEDSLDLHAAGLTEKQCRWLGLRLSFAGHLLVLVVALFGIMFRKDVSSANLGVTLTYLIITPEIYATSVLTFLQNTVERVQYYASLPSEAAPVIPGDPEPDELWPTVGAIDFKGAEMRYRPDLPLVLKGISLSIRPGEKIGVIGRTGAGKSSIAQALFRTVEICNGSIEIDGRNIADMGLDTLRHRLSIIPQDAFLFGGSVRDNIDPTSSKSDAALNDALNLIHRDPHASNSLREKFRLDVTVASEGSNFSAGERQLLALVRALVKGSKVLLLDEATSSVDPETDALIQRIIQTEFADVTLISIAHRLQTVAYYDRILVMDSGKVAEFDTPLALFEQPGSIFRSLCDKKHLTLQELIRIREDAARAKKRHNL
ncbi:hypothetical protein I316_01029 [Kwoniella heveanensis BCC8398]|uniref:Cadmium ion transporter n=1 Tax=Kwoniella heveanensis BCC8398 TaxID=1296120 RepID=A0A1B9H1H5_9TREE|nr:hypothetical protein I316_01029 [Kwoniella heveanensis BCC8398]